MKFIDNNRPRRANCDLVVSGRRSGIILLQLPHKRLVDAVTGMLGSERTLFRAIRPTSRINEQPNAQKLWKEGLP